MEVTPVMDGNVQKQIDGKPLWNVDGKEEAIDLPTLFETRSKYGTLSQTLDKLRPQAAERETALAQKAAAEQAAQKAAAEVETLKNQLAAAKLGKPDEELEAEIKRRMEKAEADHAAQVELLGKRATEAETLAKNKDQLLADELVNAGIATAAALIPNFTKAPLAITEQQALARGVWRYEDGKMVPRGADGKILYGPDGVTLITYQQWLESKTHLIGAGVNGGGARGGGGANGSKSMPRAEFEALSAAEQSRRSIEGWTLTDPT